MNNGYDIRLWRAGEMVKELGEPEYIVDGLLLEGAQSLMYAPTGHGKSFVSVDLACHIATGTPFHGLPVNMGSVVYVAAEAPFEIEKRIQAWERYHDKKTNNLRIVNVPIQLHEPDQMDALIHQAINELGASLVIFDTAERCAVGTDENLPSAVNERVNYPIQDMISRTGVTSLLVHHAGVDGRRPRGCTAWETPNDTIIRIDSKFTLKKNRHTPETITIQVEKQRGGEPVSLTVKPHVIPFRDGRTTLVLADNGGSSPELVSGISISSESEITSQRITKRDQLIGLLSDGANSLQIIADDIYEGNLQSAKNQLSKLKREGLADSDGEGTWRLTA